MPIMKTFLIESEISYGIYMYEAHALKTTYKNGKFTHRWYTTPPFLSEKSAIEHLNAVLISNKKYKDYVFKHVSKKTIFA